MIDLRREGSVFVLTMQAVENRFNRQFLDEMNSALGSVEASSGPAALVTIGGQEKFYSNGLDLDWLGGDGQSEAPLWGSAEGNAALSPDRRYPSGRRQARKNGDCRSGTSIEQRLRHREASLALWT